MKNTINFCKKKCEWLEFVFNVTISAVFFYFADFICNFTVF